MEHTLKALLAAAEDAEQWFAKFGYNRWGIAVKDDHPDYQPILVSLRAAIAQVLQAQER